MKKLLALTVTFVLFASPAFAGLLIQQNQPYPGSIDFPDFYAQERKTDYGNAPSPYGEAKHNRMGLWQRLGNVNDSTDGVSWSVNGSDFGTSEILYKGQEVTFKFDFWQSNTGTHPYDQLVSYIDWDQNGAWASDKNTLWQDDPDMETILYQQVEARDNPTDHKRDNNFITQYSTTTTFLLNITIPEDALVGTTWMRTRVHCWHVSYPNISPYGNLSGQGETLDVQLIVASSPVPEPGTILLFGTGIAGLATVVRRKKK